MWNDNIIVTLVKSLNFKMMKSGMKRKAAVIAELGKIYRCSFLKEKEHMFEMYPAMIYNGSTR